MPWRFIAVVVATACVLFAIGVFFFAPFEELIRARNGSGHILRGVAAMLGENAARYLASLFFLAMAALVLWPYQTKRKRSAEADDDRDT